MARSVDTAFVTLATNDVYALGALVLCYALKETQTAHAIVVLVTDGISGEMLHRLEQAFDQVVSVQQIDSNDHAMLALLRRPELGVTLTKLHVWRLRQFNKVVFLDADVFPLQNIDDLFDRPELSAAPDAGWPDCFNSGLFVCVPSEITFNALTSMLTTEGSFDGGDQGLLNQYFSHWAQQPDCRLPFVYNVVPSIFYTYTPAIQRFFGDIKVFHFSGAAKPWSSRSRLMESSHSDELLRRWWAVHDRHTRGRATPGLPATAQQDASSYSDAAVGGSPQQPRASSVSGVDPRTLSSERLAHLKTFQEYRVTWDEVARASGGGGNSSSRKISLSAPIGGAESPRPPQEWANAIVTELQAVNDKVADLRRGIPRRDEKEIEKLEERISGLTELLSAIRSSSAGAQ